MAWAAAVAAIAATVTLSAAPQAEAACPAVLGDVTGDGTTSVLDVQCEILTALAVLGGTAQTPNCLAVPLGEADVDCSGEVTVVDVMHVINAVLLFPLDIAVDANGNGCFDACEVPPPTCTLATVGMPCDDGDPCTVDDRCQAGASTVSCAGVLKDCGDGDPCTADACDPADGTCSHDATGCLPPPDALACAQLDTCAVTIPALSDACATGGTCDQKALIQMVADCAALAAACAQVAPSLPQSWTCAPGWYAAGDGCDCGCGAPDPDCATDPVVPGCGEGATCSGVDTPPCVPDPNYVAPVDCATWPACAGALSLAEKCSLDPLGCVDYAGEDIVDACGPVAASCGP